MLSIPPQATKFPDGAKATDITHAERNGITWTLFPVHESQMINFPSSEPVTQCLEGDIHSDSSRLDTIVSVDFTEEIIGSMINTDLLSPL